VSCNHLCIKEFKSRLFRAEDVFLAAMSAVGGDMISTWSDWKRYPRPGRGDNIEAPITPGIYEVRIAATGALYSFGAVDNVAQALALLPVGHKSWFGRRDPATLPDLEYRTCATSTKASATAIRCAP